ncbi:MGC81975 protein, putative [Trichomonas vaginalis G3]|uniref:MGC81975 protein, putative n=1 Tax=Trichomonas vaginalis (strain ATCC PRA-98 / G3) TaxID=412133 RepID=A2EPP1_TRIV3|nr:COP9 signalosome complex subunit 7/dendritic cell protein GA17 family [Trichomonas vaginalis G3]EAY05384.1 MGC81975 protein, putative [Trichomonas vaginalis G3]KAI5524070.1 COP9 signalosome complex subunit 7/dendritic cell protein GA17 family [Trichomonas vaginalis G3]|eukprot:XP_001317607.1 MGC81975 protein [Trichomonas vaginalis G3]
MEIFAYGTLNDYETIRKDLPKEYQFESDSIALNKLKSLTILSIMQDKIEYSFNQLKEDLGIDNTISAEDLITDLMSAGLYTGKIDELNGTFTCERVASRCVPNNQENISEIINDLKEFQSKIKNVIQ